jgi:hypothetical protein
MAGGPSDALKRGIENGIALDANTTNSKKVQYAC